MGVVTAVLAASTLEVTGVILAAAALLASIPGSLVALIELRARRGKKRAAARAAARTQPSLAEKTLAETITLAAAASAGPAGVAGYLTDRAGLGGETPSHRPDR